MDMEGGNGVLGPWRYHEHTTLGSGSSSSTGYTSAGTIVSSGYTSNSSSGLSSVSLGLEAAMRLDLESFDEDVSSSTWFARPPPHKKYRKEMKQEEKMKGIEILIQEFLKAKGGDISVIDLWLEHLGLRWDLDIADDIHARSWIQALAKITHTIIRFKASLSIRAEEEQQPEIIETGNNRDSIPDLFQFAQFIQETMVKLLVFVDLIVAPNAKITLPKQVTVMNRRVLQLHHKLANLLSLHDTMSEALSAIRWLFGSEHSKGVVRIQDNKIVNILSAKLTKTAESIWITMEQIRMESLLDDCVGSSCSLNTQGSSGIHEVTWFVIRYIGLLFSHYWLVDAIVSESASFGKYVPQTRNVRPLDSMIGEIVSCLQETLANISESFVDHGFKSLFLLNNSNSIRVFFTLRPFCRQEFVTALVEKVEGYMESYLKVSWAPKLACLSSPAPLCFGRNYSLLPKFESEFEKMYTTQKMWEVPNPELRGTLRRVIIEKIIPDYTKYLKDNKITNPKFSPHELKEMLQELFEG